MLGRKQPIRPRTQSLGITSGAGTAVTAGGTNVKGSYATLGTLAFGTSALLISITATLTSRRSRVDIAVNTGGADVVVIEDIYLDATATNSTIGVQILVPIAIPAGAVLKARSQGNVASATCAVSAVAFARAPGHQPRGNKVKSLTDWTNTEPTGIATFGGVTGTATAWTQIAANTSVNVAELWVQPTSNADAVRTMMDFVLEIGEGASGSEHTLVSFLLKQNGSAVCSDVIHLPIDVKAGTRLAYRATPNGTANTDSFGISVLGLVG